MLGILIWQFQGKVKSRVRRSRASALLLQSQFRANKESIGPPYIRERLWKDYPQCTSYQKGCLLQIFYEVSLLKIPMEMQYWQVQISEL